MSGGLQLAFFLGHILLDARLSALLHQFRASCEGVVLDVDQFFFQPIYFYQLLLGGVSAVYMEDNKEQNYNQQLRLSSQKVVYQDVAREDTANGCAVLASAFLGCFFLFGHRSFRCLFYNFSATRSLALRERGLRACSSASGTMTLLFTGLRGAEVRPKKSACTFPSTLPVFNRFFTNRSSSE